MDWKKLKEQTEDHIVGLIFLLVTFLCGVVWQAVPSETWKRLEEATPKRALAAVSVLLLIGLSTVLAYIFSLRKRSKGIPESQNVFSDFRVLNDRGNTLDIEVWYFCAPPDLGGDNDVSIMVYVLDKSGQPLPGGGGVIGGGEVKIFNHKAHARIQLTPRP